MMISYMVLIYFAFSIIFSIIEGNYSEAKSDSVFLIGFLLIFYIMKTLIDKIKEHYPDFGEN